MNMEASVNANMQISGQKLLYKMLIVSFRRLQAVKGDSLHHNNRRICLLSRKDHSKLLSAVSFRKVRWDE